MKCIWRNVKLMPERVNELNYEDVLMEIHDFMLALPTQWWTNRPSDTPMRTIKTIIHNMTKIKGTGILSHLNNIPKHSELNAYVIRILKVRTLYSVVVQSLIVLFTSRKTSQSRAATRTLNSKRISSEASKIV